MDYTSIIPDNIRYYLDGFRRNIYAQRMEQYCALAGEAMASTDAAELVDWMQTRVKGLFKSAKRFDQELFLLQYTVPAAIRLGNRSFAEAVNAAWNAAHPDLKFGIATFEELNSSFNTAIMGFKINGLGDKS